MSLLSSYSLFHFTSSLDTLQSILKGGLRYSWVAEKLPIRGIGYLLQSICFCNIPLSMIEEHVEWYGKYAIGFKRTALRAKGASPVFYLHSDSALLYKGKNAFNNYRQERFLPYFKQFYGEQYHPKYGTYKKKLFYDEKEWRLFTGAVELVRFKDQADLENKRLEKKNNTKDWKVLPIDPDMIEYIILEKPDDLAPFKDFLRKHFAPNVEDMLTKVLFYSQIRRDF